MVLGALLLDAWSDLVFGSACVGCRRPGRPLCETCAATLVGVGRLSPPDPAPAGLAPTFSSGDYADLLRTMVIAHKERQVHALGAPLARMLVGAIEAAASADSLADEPMLLVPIPARAATVRERGFEPVTALVRRAARILRHQGRSVHTFRLLRSDGAVLDQAGLDAAARARNLSGSMHVPSHLLRRLPVTRGRVILCDDVVTTGATLREGQRALAAVGMSVQGAAVVAATRRRASGNRRTLSSGPPSD